MLGAHEGFGTEYRYRNGDLTGATIPVDFVANAASLGATAVRANTYEELARAIGKCQKQARTSVVIVETE